MGAAPAAILVAFSFDSWAGVCADRTPHTVRHAAIMIFMLYLSLFFLRGYFASTRFQFFSRRATPASALSDFYPARAAPTGLSIEPIVLTGKPQTLCRERGLRELRLFGDVTCGGHNTLCEVGLRETP